MGGEITWECQGNGAYVFQLRFYRDCNGGAGPTNAFLKVWNHPSEVQIPLVLVLASDISPSCNPVTGAPQPITCNGGGAGAVQEFLFESPPTTLSGTPPAQGWAFTWDNFSRNGAISNLQGPSGYGLTLRAIMHAYNGQDTQPCYDSSPTFAEVPASILCTGYPFTYNQNAYDPDLDSLVYSFGEPLDDLGLVFNPPIDPVNIPWVAGFSAASPLPGPALDPGNVPATINPSTGEISFTSFTQGYYLIVVKVESYRCGQLISEVYRELQTILLGCGVNAPPTVTPPFAGGVFYDTVYAGELVTFNFASSDLELLQDGSPQSNILVPSGSQFGANFNDVNNGCVFPPCAVLSDPIPLSGINGINTNFSWQTDCNHISGGGGCSNVANTYNFVFKVTDDFCPAPGMSMPTISITVLDLPALPAPEVKCVTVNQNGSITLVWDPVVDTENSFQSYDLYSSATGAQGSFVLAQSIAGVGTNTFTDATADGNFGTFYYYLTTASGCGGNRVSDRSEVAQSMYLSVTDPATGVALLNWNPVFAPVNSSTAEDFYIVQRQLPFTGPAWTTVATVPYGTNVYFDTIDICSDSIAYRIGVNDYDANGLINCTSYSSEDGAWFTDILPPPSPEIVSISIDTATGNIVITWNINSANDTEGYIIQHYEAPDWVLFDTIYGINSTVFIDTVHSGNGSNHWFGVAAFDSCWFAVPSGPNTSGRSGDHQTMFLENELNICDREVSLTWNNYVGWSAGVQSYEIYAGVNGATMTLLATNSGTDTTFLHEEATAHVTYCYVIKAISENPLVTSLSNKSCQYIRQPAQPWVNYLGTATVLGDDVIRIRTKVDPVSAVQHYSVQRTEDPEIDPYEEVGTFFPDGTDYIMYTDIEDVHADLNSYFYKIAVIDSCGDTAMWSQETKTIFLRAHDLSDSTVNIVSWSHYEGWSGSIVEYRLYRSINGEWDPNPLAVLPPQMRVFEDYVGHLITSASGEFCYRVEAIESTNAYGFAESASSNEGCAYQNPKVWIPNAFILGGHNDVFKPVAGYIDITSYHLNIYSRWGQLLFHSSSIDQGWNGEYKNKVAAQGVYVYHIIYDSADGKTIERRGTVTLLKDGSN